MAMLLPRTCSLCGRAGPSPCGSCVRDLVRAPALAPPPGVDACAALLSYDDAGRELIARLKYRNARGSVRWLAVSMAVLVRSMTFDAVAWVPTTRARRRRRGFDQAELLARGVARELGLSCRGLLARANSPPQTGRTLAERQTGPLLVARSGRVPARVLLVDDVITTGATVSAAARALRAAGAQRVSVVAAARTPLKRARASSDTHGDAGR